MEEIKEILRDVLANQVAIFKRLEKIDNKLNNSSRSADDKTYVDGLKKEAAKFKKYLNA
jgi:hypothetical protein